MMFYSKRIFIYLHTFTLSIQKCLSFSSDAWSCFLLLLGWLRLRLWWCNLCLLISWLRFLLLLGSSKMIKSMLVEIRQRKIKSANSLDSIFTLSLADLGLHVSLGHDVSHGGSNNSSCMLHGTTSTFLGGLLLDTLLVLATVENGPLHLTRVALHKEWALTLLVDECEGLKRTKSYVAENFIILRNRLLTFPSAFTNVFPIPG